MKKYIGLVSIERERESGIQAELRSFFSDDINEIVKWMDPYRPDYGSCFEKVTIKKQILDNTIYMNDFFRPYYDYLALPLELRQQTGNASKEEIERLRHGLS